MNLVMRLATIDDLPKVLRLYHQSGLDSDSSLALTDADLTNAKQWFQSIQHYPNYKLWIAQLEEKPVGTFALLIMDNLVHQCSPSGIVEGVAVDPQFQGQGIGKQMMQFAIAQCRAAGCYKLSLSTNLKREQAHAFYESLGFQKHGYSFLVEF